jgi:hypothetical protein
LFNCRSKESESGNSHWGGRDKELLDSLECSSSPDISILTKVKLVLSSANMDSMSSFLHARGILILLKVRYNNYVFRNFMNESTS